MGITTFNRWRRMKQAEVKKVAPVVETVAEPREKEEQEVTVVKREVKEETQKVAEKTVANKSKSKVEK